MVVSTASAPGGATEDPQLLTHDSRVDLLLLGMFLEQPQGFDHAGCRARRMANSRRPGWRKAPRQELNRNDHYRCPPPDAVKRQRQVVRLPAILILAAIGLGQVLVRSAGCSCGAVLGDASPMPCTAVPPAAAHVPEPKHEGRPTAPAGGHDEHDVETEVDLGTFSMTVSMARFQASLLTQLSTSTARSTNRSTPSSSRALRSPTSSAAAGGAGAAARHRHFAAHRPRLDGAEKAATRAAQSVAGQSLAERRHRQRFRHPGTLEPQPN